MNYQDLSVLLEVSRTRRAVDSGEITDPKLIRQFKRKGWIPTKKKETRGLRRAATNMAKKAGFKVVTRGNKVYDSATFRQDHVRAVSGSHSAGRKFKAGTMYIPHDPSRYYGKWSIDPLRSAVISWHEGREAARGSSKIGKTYTKDLAKTWKDVRKRLPDRNIGDLRAAESKLKDYLSQYGTHMPGVMRDEAKLSNRLARRHGVNVQNDIVAGISRQSGERKLGSMNAKQDAKERLRIMSSL